MGVDLGTTSGCSHATHAHAHVGPIAVACVFLAVVGIPTAGGTKATWVLGSKGLKLLHVDSLKENAASQVSIVLGHG